MSVKSVAAKIDWSSLLGKLKPETVAALSGFRRRHADLVKTLGDLQAAKTTVDFAAYRRVLKNDKVVAEAERAFRAFAPAQVDLSEQLRVIEAQQKKAVDKAQATAASVSEELKDLQDLLKNIETARPVDELTVADVVKAVPDIDKTVEKLVKRGQWHIPGYDEKFGNFGVGF